MRIQFVSINIQLFIMKRINSLSIFLLFILSSLLSSCSLIGGIFKAGMGFGIFIVIAIIVLIIVVVTRIGKK